MSASPLAAPVALDYVESRGASSASALSKRKTSYIGMVLALASWAMLFASLFFAYAVLRMSAPMWPPEGTARLPRLLPTINTLVIVLSSVVLWNGRRLASESKPGALRRALLATLALGSLFLALQLAVWIPLWRQGFRIDSGIYGSIFYGLTTFHALHVLAGLVALACLLPGAKRGVYVSSRQSPVRLTAMFWDFVGVVWLVLFVAVYFL